MKLKHKINFGWAPPSEPITESYQREIDATLRRAEKAWRRAQQAAERAERLAAKRPDPETIASRDRARMAVLARLDELREIEKLMSRPTYAPTTAVHRSGRQDRLEVGVQRKPKRKTKTASPVKTRSK